MEKFKKIAFAAKFIKQFTLFFIFICIMIVLSVFFARQHSVNSYAYLNNNLNVFGLNIPSNLTFCGESLPADNFQIRNKLEKEFFTNKHWKNNSSILFSKVERWFPYIEPILKEHGVPDDLKYIAVIESHLSNITSPAGAAGFWQLVPKTAINYGLIVNDEIDERRDVEKATHAACMLFKAAYAKFGKWTLAAAAYNIGIGGLEKAMKKQETSNFFDLLLNKETGEFLYRILAYKTLLSDAEHFGIKRAKQISRLKIPTKTYIVDTTLHSLDFLAKKIGCNKTLIKLFNPWLKGEKLTNPDGIKFKLKIPSNLKRDYSAYYMDLISSDGYVNDQIYPAPSSEAIISDTIRHITESKHHK